MNLATLTQLTLECEYKDWGFVVGTMGDGYYVQVAFTEAGESWAGRKFYVSTHATRSEVVLTLLKAVLTAEEHEAREKFLYNGRAVFGPHINVDTMWDACIDLDGRTS